MAELLGEIWTILEPAREFILAVAISLGTAYLLWLFRARVKIIWGSTNLNVHEFQLKPDAAAISISTEKYFVQNMGRKPASRVEIVFSAVPTSYNLWPPMDHTTKVAPNGSFFLNVPSLAPFQLLIVDAIDLDLKNPKIVAVNCPDAITQPVSFGAQRQFGVFVTAIVAFLMFSGLIGIIYLLLQMLLGVGGT
ncbi:hypothetical protein [Nioella sp.]|uniref:hypothetical protein n=1 Tax=Nioella sp. TaxID=1912091 RepID=UPI0035153374